MKKILIAALCALLLLTAVPFVLAEDEPPVYTISAPTAYMDEMVATVYGSPYLKVDITISPLAEDYFLSSLSLTINYDPDQLTYVASSQDLGDNTIYTVNDFGIESYTTWIYNNNDPGASIWGIAMSYGHRIKDNRLFSLYFSMNESYTDGEEIPITISNAKAGFVDSAEKDIDQAAYSVVEQDGLVTYRDVYTVSYYADDTFISSVDVYSGQTLTAQQIPAVPPKEGYDKTAPVWDTDLTGVAIKQNYTVNALYTINTYTVTYMADGKQVASYTVDWNGKLTEIPAVPAKEGYDTTAPVWDTDLTNAAITEDYTVNAVYTVNTYTVTYVADSEEVASYPVNWGDTLSSIPAVPAKEGHDKTAPVWDNDLTGVAIKKDYTVTAIYTINTYEVIYKNGELPVARYNVAWGDTLAAIPEVPPVQDMVGYWSVDLTGVAIKQDYTVMAMYRNPALYGDANCDTAVNAADAAAVLRHVVKLIKLSDQGMINGKVTLPVNGNNDINAGDAAAILRYTVHLIFKFPVEE